MLWRKLGLAAVGCVLLTSGTAAEAGAPASAIAVGAAASTREVTVYVPRQNREVTLPAAVVLPAEFLKSDEYKGLKSQRNLIHRYRYTAADGRVYAAQSFGEVRGADGSERELIPKVSVYRPDGTLEAETEWVSTGVPLLTTAYDAKGERRTIRLEYNLTPDLKIRYLSGVTFFNEDGTRREWKVSRHGVVYGEYTYDAERRVESTYADDKWAVSPRPVLSSPLAPPAPTPLVPPASPLSSPPSSPSAPPSVTARVAASLEGG